ncbi:MAG: hypothetical protein EU530_08205 [Promethearchaeota archaeon]|nr:MAG: hypothetical protein EU530_08205 [Candidatus Lokiarchaeota archaeon]
MTEITVEKEFVIDLINSKMEVLSEEIKTILDKWNCESIDVFLEDARTRKLRNAEDDAIVIQNLHDSKEELRRRKENLK